jgi:1-phosphofructokinase family hexose kinase
MIFTVTLNPTLDKALSVNRLVPGEIHRARVVRQDLGGKGINVSRALRALGLESRIIGFIAGAVGAALQRGLDAAGYAADFIEVEGETRQNLTLLDESAGVYTKINEPGAAPGPAHIAALLALLEQKASAEDLWAFCGSLPPGVPDDLYAQLIRLVQGRGARAFLDTSGPALRAGVAAGPFGLKPNDEEAGELVGRPLTSAGACIAAARQLGAPVTVITRGAEGAALNFHGAALLARPPAIAARSPVGAGDAALAGLLWALSDRCDAEETARRIVACGAAAAAQDGSGVGDRALVQALLGQVQVSRPAAADEEGT